MSLHFLLRCFVGLACSLCAASCAAVPLYPPPTGDYQHWCGMHIILEFADPATAAAFIIKTNDKRVFVRDGRLVYVLAPYRFFDADKYWQPSTPLDTGTPFERAEFENHHYPVGPFRFRKLDPSNELYGIETKNYPNPVVSEPDPSAANAAAWKLIGIRQDEAIPSTRSASVAVLDTGIFGHQEFERVCAQPKSLLRHYSLTDPVNPGEDCIGDYCCREDAAPTKVNSPHGTQVAGLIAAAKDCKGMSGAGDVKELISISVLDPTLACFSRRRLAAAYLCAAKLGADVVNISMASEPDRAYPQDFEDAIHKVASQHAPTEIPLVFVAAGNKYCDWNTTKCGVWPGGIDHSTVVSVEALDISGARLSNSNRGGTVDLGVPAPTSPGLCTTNSENPISPGNKGCMDGYARFGETSAAAAIASGAATLVQGHPNFDRCDPVQIRRILRGFGIPLIKNSPASCQLQIDFLYANIQRDGNGNAINLCACDEMNAGDDCGDLREQAPLCGNGTPK